MKHKTFHLARRWFLMSDFNAMILRNEGRPLIHSVLNILRVVGGKITPNWVRLTVLTLKRLNKLSKDQGLPGTVKYLKVCSVSLQQMLGGTQTKDLTSLGPRISRTGKGIPRIIPVQSRVRISAGSGIHIQFWLTIFSFYRFIDYPGIPKFKTITDPRSASFQMEERISRFIPVFVGLFIPNENLNLKALSAPKPFPIFASAPGSNRDKGELATHPYSLARSWVALVKNTQVFASWQRLLSMLPYSDSMNIQIRAVINYLAHQSTHLDLRSKTIGKLGQKEEAAGKVRIFAMVDPWTQWLLRPLHLWIFSVLKRIPMDGTFNQIGPLSRVQWGEGCYSFDLSAATDRLPVSLQVKILSKIFNPDFAENWRILLVERSYKILMGPHIKYSVGQPMGALSSWGMLALTHHFIVQSSAWIAGEPQSKLFTRYAVLGDDIVIWDKKVADTYLKVISGLGVEVGLAKSVLSPLGTALEFAKKTFYKGVNVSPVSLKELMDALNSGSMTLLSFIKKYSLSYTQVLRILGYGYKVSLKSRGPRLLEILYHIPEDWSSLMSIWKTRYPVKWEYHMKDRSSINVSLWGASHIYTESLLAMLQTLQKGYNDLNVRVDKEFWGTIQKTTEWETPIPMDMADITYRNLVMATVGIQLKAIIKDLEYIRNQTRWLKRDVDEYISFLISMKPYWHLPPFSTQHDDPKLQEVVIWVNMYYVLTKQYDSLKPTLLLNPTYQSSKSIPDLETLQNERLWKQWSKLVSELPSKSYADTSIINKFYI